MQKVIVKRIQSYREQLPPAKWCGSGALLQKSDSIPNALPLIG